jgi:hypothetical protein
MTVITLFQLLIIFIQGSDKSLIEPQVERIKSISDYTTISIRNGSPL